MGFNKFKLILSLYFFFFVSFFVSSFGAFSLDFSKEPKFNADFQQWKNGSEVPNCRSSPNGTPVYLNPRTGTQVSKHRFDKNPEQFANYNSYRCCMEEVEDVPFKVIHQQDNGQSYLETGTFTNRNGNLISQGAILKEIDRNRFKILSSNSSAELLSKQFLASHWPHVVANEYKQELPARELKKCDSSPSGGQCVKDSSFVANPTLRKAILNRGATLTQTKLLESGLTHPQFGEHQHGSVLTKRNEEYQVFLDPIPPFEMTFESQQNPVQAILDYSLYLKKEALQGTSESKYLEELIQRPKPNMIMDWITQTFSQKDLSLFRMYETAPNLLMMSGIPELAVASPNLKGWHLHGKAEEKEALEALDSLINWIALAYARFDLDLDMASPQEKLKKIRNMLSPLNGIVKTANGRGSPIVINPLWEDSSEDVNAALNFYMSELQLLDELTELGVCTGEMNNVGALGLPFIKQVYPIRVASNEACFNFSISGSPGEKGTSVARKVHERLKQYGFSEELAYKTTWRVRSVAILAIDEEPVFHESGSRWNTDYRQIIYNLALAYKFELQMRSLYDNIRREFGKSNIFKFAKGLHKKTAQRICVPSTSDHSPNILPAKQNNDTLIDWVMIPYEQQTVLKPMGRDTQDILTIELYPKDESKRENAMNMRTFVRKILDRAISFDQDFMRIYINAKANDIPASLPKAFQGVLSSNMLNFSQRAFSWNDFAVLPGDGPYYRKILKTLNEPEFWAQGNEERLEDLNEAERIKSTVLGHMKSIEPDFYFSDLRIWFGPNMIFLPTEFVSIKQDWDRDDHPSAFGISSFGTFKYSGGNSPKREDLLNFFSGSEGLDGNTLSAENINPFFDSIANEYISSSIGAMNYESLNPAELSPEVFKEFLSESFLNPRALCSHLRVAEKFRGKVKSGQISGKNGAQPQLQFGNFYYKGRAQEHAGLTDHSPHQTHQSGVCVDYRYVRNDEKLGCSWSMNPGSRGDCTPRYNQEATSALIQLAKDAGASVVIGADSQLKTDQGIKYEASGHYHHLHICYSKYLPGTATSRGVIEAEHSHAFTVEESPNGTPEKRDALLEQACGELGSS